MTEAYKQGYADYYNGAECHECPFSYEYERPQWEGWCDGHKAAYCEDEDK